MKRGKSKKSDFLRKAFERIEAYRDEKIATSRAAYVEAFDRWVWEDGSPEAKAAYEKAEQAYQTNKTDVEHARRIEAAFRRWQRENASS